MSNLLQYKLPKELVDHVKIYTGEGCWRNGKYLNIGRISKNDKRYNVLKKMPKVRQVILSNSHPTKVGCLWYKYPNNKFIVINKGYGTFWNGYHYVDGYFCETFYDKERKLQYLV